jgi:predicted nucleotidyltransferase
MLDHRQYEPYVIYSCVVGSRAYGLEGDDSDTDRRGVFLPPAALHWSLRGVPDCVTDPETLDCYWELKPFLLLALKATPNVLECLYTPLVEHATPLARDLLALRDCFLSKLAYPSYKGYVESQGKKLGQDLRTRGEPKWRAAMHLVRFLLAGIAVLREGRVPVHAGEHRDRLMAVRNGRLSWKEYHGWRSRLLEEFEAAYAATRLPDQPDYGRVEAFLLKARGSMVEDGVRPGSGLVATSPQQPCQ